MKLEVTHKMGETQERAQNLAHVHRMTRELAFGLQLVGLGLLALAVAIFATGGGGDHDRA